jgi:hypothetical protein
VRIEETRLGTEVFLFEGEEDEDAFLAWTSRHGNHGFIVYPDSPSKTPLHYADCGHFTPFYNTAASMTRTLKYCGTNKQILLDHVQRAGHRLAKKVCKSCQCTYG